MNDTHYYEVNLFWNTSTQGTLNAPAKTSPVDVVTPPEYPKSIMEKWPTDHLSVAAINSCLMSTFLLVADNTKLAFISFESNAIGKIEKIDGKLLVTEITLKPILVIPQAGDEFKANHAIEMSEKACAILNSEKTQIILEPLIMIIK